VSEANDLNHLLGLAEMQRRALNVIVRCCLNCGLEHTRASCQVEALVDGGCRVPIALLLM